MVVGGLTSRRQAATRREIEEAAAGLFLAQGYETTTVEQIAARADVSVRTFYRYCTGKHDTIASPLENGGEMVAAHLLNSGGIPLAQAAAEGFAAFVEDAFPDVAHLRRMTALSFSIPSLRTQWLFSAKAGQGTMIDALARRRPDVSDSQLEAMAATVVAVLGTALRIWSETENNDLRHVATDCFEGVQLLFESHRELQNGAT
jgi:AcrR family transcriptional regulator